MIQGLLATQARQFAREKHKEQKRKYTGEPYFAHLEEVAQLVRTFDMGEEAEVLAYLHDTVEDTNTTHAELVEKFGLQIAMGVRALTNDVDISLGNRKARKEMDRTRLSQTTAVVQSVKCADLISNARDIAVHDPKFAVVYLDEMDELLKVLRQAQAGIKDFANMVCQVEQLYLFLNKVKQDKQEKEDAEQNDGAVSDGQTATNAGPTVSTGSGGVCSTAGSVV
jgi:Guanosine polyphosphate pyrophosphohydrolases/synthetases